MSPSWEALAARARGESGHLLDEERLEALRRATSLADLTRALSETPYARHVPPPRASTREVEVGITRSLAERLSTLARWAGPGAEMLAALMLEQDARNVRQIVRGAVGELAPEERLDGAIPTPALGRRALETLARAESPGAVAATLVAWGHPLGPILLHEARRTRPDLFQLELAIARFLGGHPSLRVHDRGSEIRRHLSDSVDARNAVAAVLLSGSRSERPATEAFVKGGSVLEVRDFVRAALAADREEASEMLARGARGSFLERPLRSPPSTPAALSARILDARIDSLERSSRREPLTPLPVLLFLLRLRREGIRVRRALWRVALTPRAVR